MSDQRKPKSTKTTYEFSEEELRRVLARELGAKFSQVELRFVLSESGDDRFGPTHTVCTGVEVTVRGT